ncbi:MAG: aminotransferase class III-fold pyridoxal phosphate-dependent enzyme [Pseudomonadota bacterium]
MNTASTDVDSQKESSKPLAPGGPQDIFYAHSNTVPLPIIERAEGIYMWDETGRDYIDACSGPVVCNIGHGNAQVAQAMANQACKLDFAYSRLSRHRPNMELTARIAALAGPGYERVCLASGGSEAMEIAIKFLRQYVVATGQNQRRKIITLQPSYHGGTIATLAMTGDEALGPFLDGFAVVSEKLPAPATYRLPQGQTVESYAQSCADALEAKIQEVGPKNILAFVVEPVGGVATGCTVAPESYIRRVRDICSRHSIYLVFDEIMCGTGRAGRFLTAHYWPDSLPDIVVLAKGLGSGYAALGAVLLPARMADHLASLTGFNYSHTYNANPIVCAAGLAVLDEYDRLDLVNAAAERGAYMRQKLMTLADQCSVIGDVRGLGLLLAVELVSDKVTKTPMPDEFLPTEKIRIHALDHGLFIYSRRTGGKNGDWFLVSPPLTITEPECDELVSRLSAAIKGLQEEFKSYSG